MIEKIYLVFEILSALLILWALHGSKKKPGIVTVVYVCLELIVVAMIAEGWISSKYIVVAYLGLYVVSLAEFSDTLRNGMLYTILSCIIMFVTQIIGTVLYSLIFHSEYTSPWIAVVVNIVVFLSVVYVSKKCSIHILVQTLLEIKIFVNTILLFLSIALIVILKRESSKIYIDWDVIIFLIIFSLIAIYVSVRLAKERYQKNKYLEQLKQYEQYNMVYKELISDIRHKQHDFNNHLQALYSITLSCNTIEELRDMQRNYYEKLLFDKDAYCLLTENVSSVLTAFLYIKFREISEFDIDINYNISINQLEQIVPFPDIVELVGNLLDNAVDATVKAIDKKITFNIEERNGSVKFEMSNPYNWMEGEDFAEYLEDGKSSKGKARGMGLSNVKNIVERYRGVMQVYFEYDDIKIIRFEIELPIMREN